MIKLNKLDKYFNRKKPNEIHVINDISLSLPDKGLVVLLGPSGSGKTTLLNVLGGLDKVQSGSIQFDKTLIDGYNAKTWDKIRNKEVGYIFQNYNLLTNLTVYENIELTLNMINIYDKEEIDKRIDYILDSMGMINYRKRKASALSGGQQQRVAIARALAKNPKVIIADEPTGNLDSKNTQEIMSIIKKISQNKLVVLVTHEENIASFYADRVIRLQDGKIISDDQNSISGSLDYRHETDIYLGDLREVDTLSTSKNNVSIYSDEDMDDALDIKLIVKNKTIYIDVKSNEYSKMQLLEPGSEINIIEGKYQSLQKETTKDSDFNLDEIINEKVADDTIKHSVISVRESIKLAWNRIKDAGKLGKMFYVGFAAVAVLIAVAVGLLNGILRMDPTNFLTGSENIVVFDKGVRDYDDIVALADHSTIEYIEMISSYNLIFKVPPIYQTYDNYANHRQNIVYQEFLDESKLIEGRAPNNIFEVVLDKDAADDILQDSSFSMLGITTYKDLMNLDLTSYISFATAEYQFDVRLVGIVQDQTKGVYVAKELLYMATLGAGLYEYYEDKLTITEEGTYTGDYPLWSTESDSFENPLHTYQWEFFNQPFTLTGTYERDETIPGVLVRTADIERAYFNQNKVANYSQIRFYSNDVDATIDYLEDEGVLDAQSLYDMQLEEYRNDRLQQSLSTIIFAAVAIGASAISYFFILRSSLLSRIYEVSVYRALGVPKGDIRKMFTVETIFITTITSMIGYVATTFLMYRLQLFTEDVFEGVIYINFVSIIIGIVIIYTVNIIAGLIPVTNLLRKTPAEILSKYDF